MSDLWQSLSPLTQDALFLCGLLAPLVVLAGVLLRGFAPLPLIIGLFRRFFWTNLAFVLLIALSVGLGIGLLSQERALRQGTAQAADKFDLVIAAPGSEVTAMLSAVYLQPNAVPLLGGDVWAEIAGHDDVEIAAPLAFGDSFHGLSIVGTTAAFVDYLTGGGVEGAIWENHDQAVIGASVNLVLGDHIVPAHGHGDAADDHAHGGHEFEVVGRMEPTGTPWDRAILVPIEAVWEVHGLANGHAPERGEQLGPPFDPDYMPGVPAVVVHSTSLPTLYALRSAFDSRSDTMAFFPGTVLAELHRLMGDVRQAMSLMALLTQGLVSASVLLALFIMARLFQKNMAVLRAIGAPSRFICTVFWSYAMGLIVVGAGVGLGLGYAAAAGLSEVISARTGVLMPARPGWPEFHLTAGFISLCAVAALLPALAVLRQPVLRSLRG
ncbi:FtsX-like permease family protein [Qingshengfaniella alkalisoli]|uniref:FtsX-like permease family protein n=1 Tax=Qingshengfaniella alkalisoli TaxID=2599296 RepID=A0A5B8JBU2_9RHOB|nr:FtsX-like permease family protein [Qingshengfaniella alkalisoli]QDY71697.1 FtsX-like permease family protein [Qingshengfaniella alkalisoli]